MRACASVCAPTSELRRWRRSSRPRSRPAAAPACQAHAAARHAPLCKCVCLPAGSSCATSCNAHSQALTHQQLALVAQPRVHGVPVDCDEPLHLQPLRGRRRVVSAATQVPRLASVSGALAHTTAQRRRSMHMRTRAAASPPAARAATRLEQRQRGGEDGENTVREDAHERRGRVPDHGAQPCRAQRVLGRGAGRRLRWARRARVRCVAAKARRRQGERWRAGRTPLRARRARRASTTSRRGVWCGG